MKVYKVVPPAVVLACLFLSIVGSILISSLPTGISSHGAPPFSVLFAAGLSAIVFTAVILALALKTGLPLKQSTVFLIFCFNALLAITKLVAAPMALYAQNQIGDGFVDTNFLVNGNESYIVIAIIVFVLYVLVLGLISRAAKKNVPQNGITKRKTWMSQQVRAFTVVLIIILFYMVGQYVLVPLLVLAPLTDYLGSMGIYVVAIFALLVIAAIIAIKAFSAAAGEAKQLRDASLMASLFWLCLSIILLYHVMWVVFMTALVTIWPFKTFISNTK